MCGSYPRRYGDYRARAPALARADADRGGGGGGGGGVAPVPVHAADADVEVANNEFRPRDVTIDAGNKVTWRFTGTAPHSVTADDRSFDSHPNCSPACSTAASPPFERTFTEPGTYRYFCKIHGGPGGAGMSGRVIVRAQDAPPAPVPTTTAPPAPPTSTATPSDRPTTTMPATTTSTTVTADSTTTTVADTVAEAPGASAPDTTAPSGATIDTAGDVAAGGSQGDGDGNVAPAAMVALACLIAVCVVSFRLRHLF